MSGSGVNRLRQAKKNHALPLGARSGPRKGTTGTNHTDVNVGSGLAPKKVSKYVWNAGNLPTIPTPPPPSNEHPSRGEHGRNTSKTSKRNDKSGK